MGGKSKISYRKLVSELSCEYIDAKPIDVPDWGIEWTGDSGETADETFYESTRCETCGEILTFAGGHSGGKHRDVIGDAVVTEIDPQDYESEVTCDGYVGTCEGPMMNYAYPCDWKDGEAAALALVDLPLVPVVLRDGSHALALTGGGMDLSWEICRAYIALGFLPPLHHCSDLPRYADRGQIASQSLVLAASERSAIVSREWAIRALARIRETGRWLAAHRTPLDHAIDKVKAAKAKRGAKKVGKR